MSAACHWIDVEVGNCVYAFVEVGGACPAGGATEIDFIEIRSDLRRSGSTTGAQRSRLGQASGQLIVACPEMRPSEMFRRSLGWVAHTRPDGEADRTLFTST